MKKINIVEISTTIGNTTVYLLNESVKTLKTIVNALNHKDRILLIEKLKKLKGGEYITIAEVQSVLPSVNVSQHMKKLVEAKLVEWFKEGHNYSYRLDKTRLKKSIDFCKAIGKGRTNAEKISSAFEIVKLFSNPDSMIVFDCIADEDGISAKEVIDKSELTISQPTLSRYIAKMIELDFIGNDSTNRKLPNYTVKKKIIKFSDAVNLFFDTVID